MTGVSLLAFLATSATLAWAKCYEPSPAFPAPQWKESGPWIPSSAFAAFEDTIHRNIGQDLLNGSSFSIEVTSGDATLWALYHTAQERKPERPGTTQVDGISQYRIASNTKVFTTLGLLYQHAAGNLSLDDPVVKYVEELKGDDGGEVPWKDITLRALASQLSGIPRDFAVWAVVGRQTDPTHIGLPPLTGNLTSICPDVEQGGSCTRADLLRALKQQKPLFAPNQKSTYSNDAFELLGLVLENVAGLTYGEYITQAILEPLNMTMTSFEKPTDDHAVLPVNQSSWDVEQGVQRPTGGLYSCATDLSKFLRYVLNHYNSIATGVNWLLPVSWGTGMKSFYGMPWEQFRSDKILPHSQRPVTMISKSGGLPGYFSLLTLLPEYNLGITLLAGGNVKILDRLIDIVLPGVIKAAEAAIWDHLATVYSGNYVSTQPSLNSSLSLTTSPSHGLTITRFISNSTDILNSVIPQYIIPGLAESEVEWHAQLISTLLYKNETSKQGEIWRMMIVQGRAKDAGVFDEWCVTDVDFATHNGLPVNEIVFWHDEGLIDIPAFNVTFAVNKKSDDTNAPGLEVSNGDGVWQNVLVSGLKKTMRLFSTSNVR